MLFKKNGIGSFLQIQFTCLAYSPADIKVLVAVIVNIADGQ